MDHVILQIWDGRFKKFLQGQDVPANSSEEDEFGTQGMARGVGPAITPEMFFFLKLGVLLVSINVLLMISGIHRSLMIIFICTEENGREWWYDYLSDSSYWSWRFGPIGQRGFSVGPTR